MYGFYNMALRVNVTQQAFDIKIIPDHVTRKFLGGKGLAIHLLRQYNPVGVDPLNGGNHLLFAIGPATGSGICGSCRHGVFTKSPQTGYYAESYTGGAVAEAIARAGIDALMIDGASEVPVWLEVSENGVTFHPADHLWALEACQTANSIKHWIKKNRPGRPESGVVAMGPVGENPGSFSLNEDDCRRRLEPTGIGAVMGSKKIKAVAFWGQRRKELAHPDLVRQFNQDIGRRSQDNPRRGQSCGTSDQGAGVSEWEDRLIIFDALILCRFYRDLYQWEDLAAILRGVTGSELDVDGLRKIAAAITEDIRHFNLAVGLTPEEDHLSEPFARTRFPLS